MDSDQNFQKQQPRRRSGWSIFWGIIAFLSILANILLFLFILVLIGFVAAGRGQLYTEKIIQKGPSDSKIAIVNLNGMINNEQAEVITEQLRMARRDDNVKALILSVNSPGGSVAASDQIYHQIMTFRKDTGRPVLAYMEGLAASGGYYSSVACDEIIAQPTTITGSIGVIMAYLVVEDLLEGKLGIEPVVVKSGPKKDWPSAFEPPSPEQLDYLQNKIIQPAYDRFVSVVAAGRETMEEQTVRQLADGSIYPAAEAVANGLIDSIGYLEDAIAQAKELAGIEKAQVVEYERPFSLGKLLSAQNNSILNFDRDTIYELSSPDILYLWLAK